MSRAAAVVILAAGKGTRMKSELPKVLHPIANAPMLHHAMLAARALGARRTAVVVGQGGEAVGRAARTLAPEAAVAVQEEQLGSGHAVLAARPALEGFDGDLFVLFADTPFLRPETLAAMQAARAKADIVVVGFEAREPGRYGRLVQDADGALEAIVEAKDAAPSQLAIRTCNSGLMAGDCATMLRLLDRVGKDNAQGEYYLTDIVALARAEGLTARVVLCDEAEARFQAQARRRAMLQGATSVAPETVWFSLDTRLGRDVTVHPHVVFGPGVSVADSAEVGYASGELKHGPIALIDETAPVVVMAPRARLFDKTVSNMQEVMARGGKVVLVTDREGRAAAGDGPGGRSSCRTAIPSRHPFSTRWWPSSSPTSRRWPAAPTSTSPATWRSPSPWNRAPLSSGSNNTHFCGLRAQSRSASSRRIKDIIG